jgi:hypothetical protein
MPLTIRATRITDEVPANADYCVYSGALNVGRIYEDITSQQPQSRWYWTIYGVHAGPSIMANQGRAATLDGAKDQFRDNWHKWLAWAKLAELSLDA